MEKLIRPVVIRGYLNFSGKPKSYPRLFNIRRGTTIATHGYANTGDSKVEAKLK